MATKRMNKKDVIKYLQGYKRRLLKNSDGNYWQTNAPHIQNCIDVLKEGFRA